MAKPISTRLRHISSKSIDEIEIFLSRLGFRVQIYGSPVWNGKKWFVFFVPPDDTNVNFNSVDL